MTKRRFTHAIAALALLGLASQAQAVLYNTAGTYNFVTPSDGYYELVASGAQGGASPTVTGGLGALVGGTMFLSAGTTLNILVGGQGGAGATGNFTHSGLGYSGGGGGGGSYIVGPLATALVVGGGGGGADGGAANGFAGTPGGNASVTNGGDIGGSGGPVFSFTAAPGGGGGGFGAAANGNDGSVLPAEATRSYAGLGGESFANGGAGGAGGTGLDYTPELGTAGNGGAGGLGGGGGGGGAAIFLAGMGGGGGGYTGGNTAFPGIPSTGGGSYLAVDLFDVFSAPGGTSVRFSGNGYGDGFVSITATNVPEPASILLIAVGLLGLAWVRRQASAGMGPQALRTKPS